MSKFAGFPTKTRYTPLPNLFFSSLLPEISDIGELQITLFVLAALYQKRGYPRFVTRKELLANPGLRQCLRGSKVPLDQTLASILEMATSRGTIIHLTLERNGITGDIYMLNTENDRKAATQIKNGSLLPSGTTTAGEEQFDTEARAAQEFPDIFSLYEENIGMLTPLIADELEEAEKLYPALWIRDAIREAVSLNKRNWRYISRILEHWSQEGKSSGTYQRHSEKKPDPDKYIRGRYGHIVRR